MIKQKRRLFIFAFLKLSSLMSNHSKRFYALNNLQLTEQNKHMSKVLLHVIEGFITKNALS